MAKTRVHWTLPQELLDKIAERAAIEDRSEPYIAEKLLKKSLDEDLDRSPSQVRNAEAAVGAEAQG